jgi:hypothetical protein
MSTAEKVKQNMLEHISKSGGFKNNLDERDTFIPAKISNVSILASVSLAAPFPLSANNSLPATASAAIIADRSGKDGIKPSKISSNTIKIICTIMKTIQCVGLQKLQTLRKIPCIPFAGFTNNHRITFSEA